MTSTLVPDNHQHSKMPNVYATKYQEFTPDMLPHLDTIKSPSRHSSETALHQVQQQNSSTATTTSEEETAHEQGMSSQSQDLSEEHLTSKSNPTTKKQRKARTASVDVAYPAHKRRKSPSNDTKRVYAASAMFNTSPMYNDKITSAHNQDVHAPVAKGAQHSRRFTIDSLARSEDLFDSVIKQQQRSHRGTGIFPYMPPNTQSPSMHDNSSWMPAGDTFDVSNSINTNQPSSHAFMTTDMSDQLDASGPAASGAGGDGMHSELSPNPPSLIASSESGSNEDSEATMTFAEYLQYPRGLAWLQELRPAPALTGQQFAPSATMEANANFHQQHMGLVDPVHSKHCTGMQADAFLPQGFNSASILAARSAATLGIGNPHDLPSPFNVDLSASTAGEVLDDQCVDSVQVNTLPEPAQRMAGAPCVSRGDSVYPTSAMYDSEARLVCKVEDDVSFNERMPSLTSTKTSSSSASSMSCSPKAPRAKPKSTPRKRSQAVKTVAAADEATTKQERDQKRLAERRKRRRETHNAVERRRRDLINECIAELATLLPRSILLDAIAHSTGGGTASHIDLKPFARSLAILQSHDASGDTSAEKNAALLDELAQSKPNKGIVLKKSVEHIKHLHELCDSMRSTISELQTKLAGQEQHIVDSTDGATSSEELNQQLHAFDTPVINISATDELC